MEELNFEPKKKFKPVFVIIDRDGMKKPYFLRIGTAFINHDESINVRLDAAPLSGTLHIRDFSQHELDRMNQRATANGGAQ